MRHDIGIVEMAASLRRTLLADRQQARQPAIGRPVRRIAEQAPAVAQVEAAADDEADAGLLRRLMRAHHPGQRVAVGDGEGGVAERRGGHRQLLRMRAAAQEGEVAGDLQLGVAGHRAARRRAVEPQRHEDTKKSTKKVFRRAKRAPISFVSSFVSLWFKTLWMFTRRLRGRTSVPRGRGDRARRGRARTAARPRPRPGSSRGCRQDRRRRLCARNRATIRRRSVPARRRGGRGGGAGASGT